MERRRVLIVDDNQDVGMALGTLLEMAGYEVLFEANAQAGLATAEAKRPDAVLLDLRLPTISGFELCRTLRSKP